MIMVANKRSQENMNQDLKLFLGSNTGKRLNVRKHFLVLTVFSSLETFVNWLHQVLQKLQEVTLPNNCKFTLNS